MCASTAKGRVQEMNNPLGDLLDSLKRLLLKPIPVIIVFTVIIVGVVVGVVIPGTSKPSAEFTDPVDGALVQQAIGMTGKAYDIPQGDTLWIVSLRHATGLQYLFRNPISLVGDDWEIAQIFIGPAGEQYAGEVYDLSIVLADASAQAAFQDYIDNVAPTAPVQIPQLPDGAETLATITVTRQ